MAAVVDMKQRNPTWGCPRIAQQIALAFGIPLNKDVVRRILAARYRPAPGSAGPSWLTVLGQAKDSPAGFTDIVYFLARVAVSVMNTRIPVRS